LTTFISAASLGWVPLYVVRWANLSASLIRAHDEDHLQQLLDEIGDPGVAIWEEYEGPVWIEFEPPLRESESGKFEIAVDFHAETEPWDIWPPGVASTDTGMKMYWTILKRLFPQLHVALRQTAGSDLSTDQVKALMAQALASEDWHGTACEERRRRYAGGDNIMGLTGLSVIPKHIGTAILAGLEDAKNAGRDIEDEIMAMAAQQRDDIAWREAQYARLEAERERAWETLQSLDDFNDDDFDDGDFDDD
jgi:hypothetical protein